MSDWRITRDGYYMPVITKSEDGTLVLDWPDGTPNTCVVAKETLVKIVDALNAGLVAVRTAKEAHR